MKTPETAAYEALLEVRRLAGLFTKGDLTIHAHPDVARALRLTVQAAGPGIEGAVVERLRIVESTEWRPDQFDVSAI